MVRRCESGPRSCGSPLGSPMILGAGFAPGLVQDGGSVAGDAEPEGPALVPFFLGDPALQLLSLRGL